VGCQRYICERNSIGQFSGSSSGECQRGSDFHSRYADLARDLLPDPLHNYVVVSAGTADNLQRTCDQQFWNTLASVPVTLNITGANVQQLEATTGSNGVATFIYIGTYAGTDNLQAQANPSGGSSLTSNQTSVTWVDYAAPPQAGSLTLNSIAIIGPAYGLYANATNSSGSPLYNANVGFYVTGAQTLSTGGATDTVGNADSEFNPLNSEPLNIVAVDSVNRMSSFECDQRSLASDSSDLCGSGGVITSPSRETP